MRVMVLRDGETYTVLAGCMIVEVPDDLLARLEAGDMRASDLHEHGTRLFTFHGAETGLVSLTAEERQFVTDAMDAFEENLQLDSENLDWDGRRWGTIEERLSESIAGKLRRAAISEADSEAQSTEAEMLFVIFPRYPDGDTGDAIEELTAKSVAELLPALERATMRLQQGIVADDAEPSASARVLELTLELLPGGQQ